MKLWNIDFQSVGPAEFYFAETGEAGNMPAGRTGQRPVLHRNTDLQSVRPAEFYSAEPAANRQLYL